ncbi:MAG: hypothetical protein AAF467_06115 [Actinomycetota bacterium]
MRRGLTEAEAQAAIGDLDQTTDLPPEQIAALRLGDALTEAGPPTMPDGLLAELRSHFDDGQILELATALAVASGWQRFIELFDIRPDHWSEATPQPARPDRHPDDADPGNLG